MIFEIRGRGKYDCGLILQGGSLAVSRMLVPDSHAIVRTIRVRSRWSWSAFNEQQPDVLKQV